jgi:hypothetical protein
MLAVMPVSGAATIMRNRQNFGLLTANSVNQTIAKML